MTESCEELCKVRRQGFLQEQMKQFPKYFMRLAELEAYYVLSEVTIIKKKVQLLLLISENSDFQFHLMVLQE